jgi:purine-binding chemotaxis protein CheW
MDDPETIYIEPDEESLPENRARKKLLRVLAFRLGEEFYCVDIRKTREVVRMPEPTRIPNVPSFVIGAANLRGEIVSLLDLRYFFGMAPRGSEKNSRVIVTDLTGDKIGLAVDEVTGMLDLDAERLQEPLATLQNRAGSCAKGQIHHANMILTLFDLEKILNCDEITSLQKGGGS